MPRCHRASATADILQPPSRAALRPWILLRNSIILFFFFQVHTGNNSSFEYHPRYILNNGYNNFPSFPPPTKQLKKKKKGRKEVQMERRGERERKRNRREKEGRRERGPGLSCEHLPENLWLVFSPGGCAITMIAVLNSRLPGAGKSK